GPVSDRDGGDGGVGGHVDRRDGVVVLVGDVGDLAALPCVAGGGRGRQGGECGEAGGERHRGDGRAEPGPPYRRPRLTGYPAAAILRRGREPTREHGDLRSR